MLGRVDADGSSISQVVQLKDFYETRGTPLAHVTTQRLDEALAAKNTRSQMRGKPDFDRFKRGVRILTEGLSEEPGSERLHQFMRAFEALALPETGKTRKQLIHRGKLLTTAATGTGFVLGQLFDMRSDVEHVHDLSRSIHYVPLAHREAIALHRTRQAEALVCFAYRSLLIRHCGQTSFPIRRSLRSGRRPIRPFAADGASRSICWPFSSRPGG